MQTIQQQSSFINFEKIFSDHQLTIQCDIAFALFLLCCVTCSDPFIECFQVVCQSIDFFTLKIIDVIVLYFLRLMFFIDPSTVFLTFDMDQLAKIHRGNLCPPPYKRL